MIGTGALALVGQLAPGNAIEFLFGSLGLILLALGGFQRTLGLVIPGAILMGLGAGIALLIGPFAGAAEGLQASVFLLAFGASLGLISLVWSLAAREFTCWPLIPGGFLALTGKLLLAGEPGREALVWLGAAWPVAMIAVGVYLLVRRLGHVSH